MVEYLPALKDGEVVLTSSTADVTRYVLFDKGISRWFVWVSNYAKEVTELLRDGKLVFGDEYINIKDWFGEFPKPLVKIVSSIDEYVRLLSKLIGDGIKDKDIILSFSGGKDSVTAFKVLTELRNYVNFNLHVIYVHMPYLEPERNLRFIDEASKRLGISIEVTSPPKWLVKEYLINEGLPYRRSRWCTYLKTKPIKLISKSLNSPILAIGDRLWEARKRFSRLSSKLLKESLLEGRKFYPIAPLTLIDVVSVTKEVGLIHPDYLEGLTRVSCLYCPYKSIFEFKLTRAEVEDPGFIEEVMKREWRRWYSRYVDLEEFTTYHLWRFIPTLAKVFRNIKSFINELDSDFLGLDQIKELNTYIWRYGFETPLISRYSLFDIIKYLINKA